jgi:gluconate kinase
VLPTALALVLVALAALAQSRYDASRAADVVTLSDTQKRAGRSRAHHGEQCLSDDRERGGCTTVKVVVISGSMGSGKTTVMAEASDLLTASDIAHAAIDLDALGVGHLRNDAWNDLTYQNLASLWANYSAAGVTKLLIAEAVENRAELDLIRKAIPGSQIIVCRLKVRLETMQQRVFAREPGMLQEQLVARVAALEASLDAAGVEDFSIENDDGAVTDVARAVLVRAGWL